MEKTISAYDARRRFGQLLEEAFYQKDHFVVERSGRPMAAIVPIDEYHKWQQLGKEQVFAMLETVWARTLPCAGAGAGRGRGTGLGHTAPGSA